MTNLHIMVKKALRNIGLAGLVLGTVAACARVGSDGREIGAFESPVGYNVSSSGVISGIYGGGAILRDGSVNPTSDGYEVRLGATSYLVPLNSGLGSSLAGAIATNSGFTSAELGSNLGSRLSQYRIVSPGGDERQDNNDTTSDDDGDND